MFYSRIKTYIRSNFTKNNENARDTWVSESLLQLPEGCRILDAGAGEGRYKHYCTHLDYVSQDFGEYDGQGNGAALQTGSWNTKSVDIICDISSIPEPDSSFDAILCTEVFEHLPSPIEAIREFSRLLKPGGKLILTAPFASITHFAPYHYYSGFNRYFYQTHLESCNFSILKLEPNGNYFALIAQEILRLPKLLKQYRASILSIFFVTVLSSIEVLFLRSMVRSGKESADLACFGYHVFAEKL